MYAGCESFKSGGKETSTTSFLILWECGFNFALVLIEKPLYLKTLERTPVTVRENAFAAEDPGRATQGW